MSKKPVAFFSFGLILVLFLTASASAQQHRATRLGNPGTRFDRPLYLPEDLRTMFGSPAMRADIEFIIRETGYSGVVEDVFRAAATNPIAQIRIPVGTILPAMSSRENGKPILLREVLWEGDEPIAAFEFLFTSNGRHYKVVAPQACANFWVEDLGMVRVPRLALTCDAVDEVLLRQKAQVCLTLQNVGDGPEPLARVALPIPNGATLVGVAEGGKVVDGIVVWEIKDLSASASYRLCAVFDMPQLGSVSYRATATGSLSAEAQSGCETRVVGVPAVMIEVVDLHDPIEVGENETYEITVLNQGTAALTHLKLVCTLEPSQKFLSGTGTSTVSSQGQVVTLETLAALAPKERATWRVIVKTLADGDIRFAAELVCDQFPEPIRETEATQQY